MIIVSLEKLYISDYAITLYKWSDSDVVKWQWKQLRNYLGSA